MSSSTTAAARFQRLLHVIPAASGKGGASFEELARVLDTTPDRILDDLNQLTTRAFYHPAGWPDDIQIFIQPDRVELFNPSGLERPVQLSSLETLCLAIGLRGTSAASHVSDPEARDALRTRAEEHLAAPHTEGDGPAPLGAPDLAPDFSEIREEVMAAARERRTCAILYMKPGADEPTARVIHPYTLVYAGGHWYTVGHCAVNGDIRVFRTDRILEACRTDHAFDLPESFRVEEYLNEGSVYHAPNKTRVRVRYSPRIARWIRERAHFESWKLDEEADGAVVLEHAVSDPQWVVSHALQYGEEAEVLEPLEYRALVREVAEEMAG